ncbi:MAG TPA: PQQ-binding-like beta-propeller repeat protein [Polyangiaceae bacterium]|nr:PQQ-binding-like beta-propeller repeat protein [Polyangiaceae bacterium]
MSEAVTTRCPNCGAHLPIESGSAALTCKFCGVTSRAPAPPRAPTPPWTPPTQGPIVARPVRPAPPRTAGVVVLVAFASLVAVGAGAAILALRSAPTRAFSPPEPVTAHAFVPAAVPTTGPSLRFERGARPLVGDLDGDGAADILVRSSTALIALDGKTGKERWRATPKAESYHSAMTRLGNKVLVSGDVSVEAFVATLADKVRHPCRGSGSKARFLLAGNDVAVLDIDSGAVTEEKKGAPCDDAVTDGPMEADVERRHFPVDFLPGDLQALSCGGVNVQGSFNYVSPDPCGPALRMSADALGEIDPDAAIPLDGGHVLVGRKRRGKKAPMAAYAKQGKLVWQSACSTDEPADLKEESADAVGFDGTRLAVGCSIGGAPHLVVFDAKSGKRISDAVLAAPAATVTALGDGRWLVMNDSRLWKVDERGASTALL